jgi:hypothetical protein
VLLVSITPQSCKSVVRVHVGACLFCWTVSALSTVIVQLLQFLMFSFWYYFQKTLSGIIMPLMLVFTYLVNIKRQIYYAHRQKKNVLNQITYTVCTQNWLHFLHFSENSQRHHYAADASVYVLS